MKRHAGVMLLVVSLLIASTSLASAAPRKNGGGGGGGSSIWVDSASTLRSADGFLHYGDQMRFGYQTSYTATDGSGPWLVLECYIGGVLVLSDVRAGFPGGYGYGVDFNLGPTARWSGGDANCTGILGHQGNRSFVKDATTQFLAKA